MGHELGSRDCKAMAVSALTGLVLYDDKSFVWVIGWKKILLRQEIVT